MKDKKFNRGQIYDLVWSKPIRAICQEFNISDTYIKNICKQMDIPFPGNGYWSKIRFGKKVNVIQLLNNENALQQAELSEETVQSEEDPILTEKRRIKEEIDENLKISWKVPKRLTFPDPMILAAKKSLESKEHTKMSYHGVYSTRWEEINIRVSEENIPRALRFMDYLIKILKMRGHQIVLQYDDTLVKIFNEEIKIALKERMKREIVQESYGYNST